MSHEHDFKSVLNPVGYGVLFKCECGKVQTASERMKELRGVKQ